MFRTLSAALSDAVDNARDGKIAVPAFHAWLVPRLRFFIGQLEHHHEIEDVHYFPLLTESEPRLQRGFDILEKDHTHIHGELAKLHAAWAEVNRAVGAESAEVPAALNRLAKDLGGFLHPLERHLHDEEDLIIPILLDRGETALG